MKRSMVGFAVVLALVVSPAVAQQPATLSPEARIVVKSNTAFALDLYGQLARQEGNLFFSPYSLSTALAMTYAGARGETATQMSKSLGYVLYPEALHPGFADLRKQIEGAGQARQYELYTANRLWGQKGYGFLPEFLQTTVDHYGAGLEEVDFLRAREGARKTINAWIEEQTSHKVAGPIGPDTLNAVTRLILTNAIYFKGSWEQPFEEKQTREGDFTLADGKKVTARLMHAKYFTGYFKGDTFAMLELPYRRHELAMIVFLPDKADGLPDLEERLTEVRTRTAVNLTPWLGRLARHEVDMTLPRFTLTSEFTLNKVLSNMGMPIAFDQAKADFSSMATHELLFLSEVLHNAFVDVNETGTEAAAASRVGGAGKGGRPQLVTFVADHPFVFLIRDNRTGSVLFLGRVVDPRG
jgi:serpin B